jgi:CysZ protein
MSGFFYGTSAFLRGLRWLGRHPFYLLFLFFPISLSLTGFLWSLSYLWSSQDWVWQTLLWSQPETWWAPAVFFVLKCLLGLLILGVAAPFFVLFSNVVSAPIFDQVSKAVERDLTGRVVEVSFWKSLLLIKEELKKVCLVCCFLFLLAWIPVVHFLVPFCTAFFLAWDAYDLPLARRGYSLRERLRFIRRHFLPIAGLSLWFLIPGAAIFLMPLAIVGGSLLAVEGLEKPDAPL